MVHTRHETTIREPAGFPGVLLKIGRGPRAERVHAHREHSVGFVAAGSTTVRLAHRAFPLREGEWVYFPPGVPHLCSPDDPARFCFEVLYWTEAANRASGLAIGDSFARTGRDATAGIAERIARIGEARLNPRERLAELFSPFLEESAWIVGPFPSALGDAREFTAEGSPRERTSRPTEGVPIASGSRFARYRQSRAKYGCGAHGLDVNRRIERAKALLGAGRSVADAAAECDFCDQSHFTRTFRLYTGLCPEDFKRK